MSQSTTNAQAQAQTQPSLFSSISSVAHSTATLADLSVQTVCTIANSSIGDVRDSHAYIRRLIRRSATVVEQGHLELCSQLLQQVREYHNAHPVDADITQMLQ